MINPQTGMPETPEEEQARLNAMFAAPAPSVAAPPLLATAPLPGADSPIYSGEPAAGLKAPSGIPASGLPQPIAAPTPSPALAMNSPAPVASPPSAPRAPKAAGAPRGPDELTSIARDRQAANTDMTEAAAETARLKADAAAQAADALQAQQEQAAKRQELAKGEYDRLQGIAKEEDDKYKSAGFRDFWADKSSGTKALAAISMALGSLGQGLAAAGGANLPNTALALINQAIDRDWAIQKERMSKQKDIADASRQDAHGASLAWQAAEANTIARQKDALAAAADKAAAANGSAEARAKGAAISGQLRQDALELRQKAQQANAQLSNTRADTVLKGAEANKANAAAAAAGGDSTRAAGKQIELATMASQMHDDAKVIEKTGFPSPATLQKLQDNETALKAVDQAHGVSGVLGTMLGRRTGVVPKNRLEGISPEQQRAVNSWDLLSKKAATVLSGQGHANVESTMAMMMPKAGDTPDVIKQKFDNLMHIADNAQVLSGKYGQKLDAADAAKVQAPAGKLDQLRSAQEWLRANPNDPRAGAVRTKVTELMRGGL